VPTLKYQNNGGPSIVDGLKLLAGSDTPAEDQKTFLKAQIIFWLIGATDGHAKNFSIFLGPRGRLRMTPIYDVLTSQPSLACRKVERKQMKLAMSVGDSRHYRIDEIKGRHFIQTAKRAGASEALARDALLEIVGSAETAIAHVETRLPRDFPQDIHASVKASVIARLKAITI
jgi:serine/threonine-protein kinase HipA